ncbi:MAG: NAD(P)H-dependent oxidoreductase subunit E [Planctomycetota bacterium]
MPFTFSDDSRKQFDWLLTRYPEKRAALLPAMRLVEEQQGCVDNDSLDYLATELRLAPVYVWSVFTFYSHYRRPEDGKYLVMVCAGLPCALRGARMIVDTFKQELGIGIGQTTADKMFTLRKVECLGSCTSAPVCQINDDYYENLTPEKIKEIVSDLKAGNVPRHISNGPTLEGGKCGYRPMMEESRE